MLKERLAMLEAENAKLKSQATPPVAIRKCLIQVLEKSHVLPAQQVVQSLQDAKLARKVTFRNNDSLEESWNTTAGAAMNDRNFELLEEKQSKAAANKEEKQEGKERKEAKTVQLMAAAQVLANPYACAHTTLHLTCVRACGMRACARVFVGARA